MNEQIKKRIHLALDPLFIAFKWAVLAILSGIIIGFVGAAFCICMNYATTYRLEHPNIIFLLPDCPFLSLHSVQILNFCSYCRHGNPALKLVEFLTNFGKCIEIH